MEIATIPATAKVAHIRAVLQRLMRGAKREMNCDISIALEYLNSVEAELRK